MESCYHRAASVEDQGFCVPRITASAYLSAMFVQLAPGSPSCLEGVTFLATSALPPMIRSPPKNELISPDCIPSALWTLRIH